MYRQAYQKKLTTPEKAVAAIADAATIVHGMATGEPPALLGAIADRVRQDDLRDIRVFSLLNMENAARTILSPDLGDRIHLFCWFMTKSARDLERVGLDTFVPNEFHRLPRYCREFMDIDVVVTAVSPMDKAGFFTFGTINDFISTAARHCKRQKRRRNQSCRENHSFHLRFLVLILVLRIPPIMSSVKMSITSMSFSRSGRNPNNSV